MAALTDGDVASALAREHELWRAYQANDRARLEALVDPMALDVGPGGAVLPRDRVFDALDRMEIVGFEIHDLSVRSLDDVDVVTYRADVDGTYRGAPFPARAVVVTSVWAHGDSGWRLIHRHEAGAGS